ncbi:bacillithiol biosynthesis cysteine-adding enzyme BshC [Niallia sp. NCCP-28]|uniref:bacillithiol biosynthesis cysteine-adding enzyme BshC n=1 Tax=Niallia sp. NCCP-28 TaxID=2934712 RepID=UPI0020846E3A|nr:bacillithiol biosynthesis cysteine-adding enzyme BshC [Niallia sp. NCCP-28]GKU82372.1 putative cysteine ligase BshC [Niallia sp. NCCP-28]
MEMLNLSLQSGNSFVTNYLSQTKGIMDFFHYSFSDDASYKERVKELQSRQFMRNEVADYIEKYMEKFSQSKSVQESISKLRKKDSAVVIGGQQAGMLTGPLYSIHKVISIILLAEQKEKELGIPVVPVFWVAGEDHDYLEINHIYTPGKEKMKKTVYPEKVLEKKMASDILLDKKICKSWIEEVVESFGETEYSKPLLQLLKEAVDKSDTVVDLFSYLTMSLFQEYGLLLVDSGDKNIRLLEKEIFLQQINLFQGIAASVKEQQHIVENSGYSLVIEMSENPVNLFYYDETIQERVLLQYDAKEQLFIGKNSSIQFTVSQLKEIASEFPNKLSNNVVTRPMTQDLLFPTLAFIGGPGEIAYWAELKKAFEHLGIKMPPIVPRLNLTFLERGVEADIKELNLDLLDVLTHGTSEKCSEFLQSVSNEKVECLVKDIKEYIQQNYRKLEEEISKEEKGLLPLLAKNESFLISQLEFFEGKVESSVKIKHEVIVNKFNRIERNLKPEGSLQERIWNITYFLNKYGLDFLDNIMELPMEFDGKHKLIKL